MPLLASGAVERRATARGIGAIRARAVTGYKRRVLVVAAHALLSALALHAACWLRFDGAVPPLVLAGIDRALPLVVVIRGVTFAPLGLYGGLWRYTSIWDLSRILLAVGVSSVIIQLMVYEPLGRQAMPRSIIVIESLLLVSLLCGVRLIRRLARAHTALRGQRVLIIGAGDAGEMIVREMRRGGGYHPVGFIDDNRAKVGNLIHGVRVLGTRADLPAVIDEMRPQEVLVAIPSANAAAVRSLLLLLEPFKLPITTLPDLKELVNGKVAVKQIRPLVIEDLLPRSPITLNTDAVRQLVVGKCVLVTGAGGTIGSELCRQILAAAPATLVLFERYENSLYEITNDLTERGGRAVIRPTIGDVTDVPRLESVFAEYRPDLVFHAAAHKHVPLMEGNACEAVKNNVDGTRLLAEAARRHRVECLVLISSDKAANPSSVMGATKRVAELIVQALSTEGSTRFLSVRFGNVLGSNGSVVPRMLDQIRAGGPVTVTDPEIRRYFMLIPEAVELVLQAAVLARTRETFVLDMGEQLKVLDIARNLIRLAGYVPEQEIPITFIGLRPGEKLVEELVGDGEVLEPSEAAKIFRVRWPEATAMTGVMAQVDTLVRAARRGDTAETIAQLLLLVPTFRRPATEKTGAADRGGRSGRSRPAAPAIRGPAVSDARVATRRAGSLPQA